MFAYEDSVLHVRDDCRGRAEEIWGREREPSKGPSVIVPLTITKQMFYLHIYWYRALSCLRWSQWENSHRLKWCRIRPLWKMAQDERADVWRTEMANNSAILMPTTMHHRTLEEKPMHFGTYAWQGFGKRNVQVPFIIVTSSQVCFSLLRSVMSSRPADIMFLGLQSISVCFSLQWRELHMLWMPILLIMSVTCTLDSSNLLT